MANELGFSTGDATLVATAISELARNIVSYAGKGQVTIKMVNGLNRQGIAVIASDDGPGRKSGTWVAWGAPIDGRI